MLVRLIIIGIFFLSACRTGLIDCPDARGPKARHTIINTNHLKPEDLYVSSINSKERYDARSYAKLKEQRHNVKDASTIEEWDCPRPGEKKKNDKIVKDNIKRMEKKMQEEKKKGVEYDSLSGSVAPKFNNNP